MGATAEDAMVVDDAQDSQAGIGEPAQQTAEAQGTSAPTNGPNGEGGGGGTPGGRTMTDSKLRW